MTESDSMLYTPHMTEITHDALIHALYICQYLYRKHHGIIVSHDSVNQTCVAEGDFFQSGSTFVYTLDDTRKITDIRVF